MLATYTRSRCTLFDPDPAFKCIAIKVHHFHLMGKPAQLCMLCISLLYCKHVVLSEFMWNNNNPYWSEYWMLFGFFLHFFCVLSSSTIVIINSIQHNCIFFYLTFLMALKQMLWKKSFPFERVRIIFNIFSSLPLLFFLESILFINHDCAEVKCIVRLLHFIKFQISLQVICKISMNH